MKKILLPCLCAFFLSPCDTNAQIMYGIAGGGGTQYIIQINAATCETCPVLQIINDGNISDLAVLPNGNIITVGPFRIRVYDPPSSVPIATLGPISGQFPSGVAVSASGTVYVSGSLGLGTYNPVTNTYTHIGPFPAAFPQVNDLFYDGTQLMGTDGGLCLVLVNVTNPSLSTLSGTCLTPPIDMTGTTLVPGSGLFGGNADILFSIDAVTGVHTTICDFTVLPYDLTALEYVPASIPMPGCLCLTNAGTVPSTNLTRCTNQTATVPYNNNATLDGNDILRYILFSNPNDTLGSIVGENGTGVFDFDLATMQTGVTYYLATMAGNNLNGSVDPNDPCLDFSNAATLVWRPTPTVAFSIANTNVCVGNCLTLNVTLTGTPPFTLTYNTSFASGLTQTFSGNTGTLTVCVPVGATPGGLGVQATSLVDAWCGCLI
jgi:hypothetical protein